MERVEGVLRRDARAAAGAPRGGAGLSRVPARRERQPLPAEHGVRSAGRSPRRTPRRSRCASRTSPRRARSSRAKGVAFEGETFDTGVCHMAHFKRPGRQRADASPPLRAAAMSRTPITRSEAAKRFAELPLPSTSDEHWRFTDLRGFDPQDASRAGRGAGTPRRRALDLDVSGRAVVDRERHRDPLGCPRASRSSRSRPTTRRSSSPTTTSSRSRTSRAGSTGCSFASRRAS